MLSAFGLNTERKSNAVSEHTVADNWPIGLSMYPGGGTNYTRCTCSIRLIGCRTRSYGGTRGTRRTRSYGGTRGTRRTRCSNEGREGHRGTEASR